MGPEPSTRIVKARRPGSLEPSNPTTTFNPFATISLTAPNPSPPGPTATTSEVASTSDRAVTSGSTPAAPSTGSVFGSAFPLVTGFSSTLSGTAGTGASGSGNGTPFGAGTGTGGGLSFGASTPTFGFASYKLNPFQSAAAGAPGGSSSGSGANPFASPSKVNPFEVSHEAAGGLKSSFGGFAGTAATTAEVGGWTDQSSSSLSMRGSLCWRQARRTR